MVVALTQLVDDPTKDAVEGVVLVEEVEDQVEEETHRVEDEAHRVEEGTAEMDLDEGENHQVVEGGPLGVKESQTTGHQGLLVQMQNLIPITLKSGRSLLSNVHSLSWNISLKIYESNALTRGIWLALSFLACLFRQELQYFIARCMDQQVGFVIHRSLL